MQPRAGGVDAAALFNQALAMMRQGRWEEALRGYDEVLALEPANLPSLNNRGIVLDRLGRSAEALASYDAALALNPADPLALNNRGETLGKLKRPEEALASFDAAVAAAPDFAEAHANRGRLLGQLGRLDEAAQALQRAIELQPASPHFYHHLAPLRRFSPGDPLLARMRDLSARPLSEEGRIELGFALAKALADVGEHDEAFEQLSRANRLKRAGLRYDEAAVLAELGRIGERFGEAFQSRMQGAGDPEPAPILIVGMPRSGSTLVEQILASHPQVFAAGERSDLDDALAEALQRAGAAPFPDGAAGLSPEAVRAIGQAYVGKLAAASGGAPRVVDKTLSNHRLLGLVHAALPSARIVHVRRDPVDACLSCYRLLFGGEQPFAYDLGELGRYHRAVEGLMDRWRALLPAEVLLELEYEALIADPEAQVRRLLEHCGLEWDPACLQFHRTERFVTTSSAAQVRQPLYARAIGSARAYERHLGVLRDALGLGSQAAPEAPAGVLEASGQAGDSREMTSEELERKAAAGDVSAQKALAGVLDAEGRHTEAIEWLARAGQAGDADALTVLGLRLLVGQDAPFLPFDATGLLSNAASAGGARAMEHLAVLIGGGFYARQNWPAALDLLRRAADLGSASAQAQLQLLAGRDRGVETWESLSRSIDLGAWTRAPQPRTLLESPRVQTVEKLIPPAVCDWIIGQCASRLVRAELYDPQTGLHAPGTETRLNRIANFNLAETNFANLMVQARMAAAVGAPMAMVEPFAVLNYAPGEEYGEHVDYLDPAIAAYAAELAQRGQRVATCLIYLNDDYEGGETEFPQLGLSFRGGKGDALIFFSADPASGRPDARTVHAGRTPTSGQKWLLSQFVRNRPVVGGDARRN